MPPNRDYDSVESSAPPFLGTQPVVASCLHYTPESSCGNDDNRIFRAGRPDLRTGRSPLPKRSDTDCDYLCPCTQAPAPRGEGKSPLAARLVN